MNAANRTDQMEVTVADSPNALAGLCRLTVRAPQNSFDLAVPTDIQVADLLPTMVGYAGTDLDETGLKHGGWIVQKLGEEPLSVNGTAETLGLLDGQVLYLRPQRESMPPVHFDDLVHGVMSGLLARSDSWRPELSRRLLLATMLGTLVLGLGVLALPGNATLRTVVALTIGAGLLATASSASRAMGDAAIATAGAGGGLGYVVLAAVLIQSGPGVMHERLFAGGLAGAGVAALACALIGTSVPFFLGVGALGLLSAFAGSMFTLAPDQVAAILAIVIVLISIFVPGWAFWLSGLRLPPLPATAEQLQEGVDPHPSETVLARGALADGYLTGLLAALGTAYTGCLFVLVTTGSGRVEQILAGMLSLLAILHGRTLGALWHRLSVVLPGILGFAAMIAWIALRSTLFDRMFLVAVLFLVAVGLGMAAWAIPGRRMVPHWARAAEIAHTMAAISLIPLLLSILGTYHYLRGLGG